MNYIILFMYIFVDHRQGHNLSFNIPLNNWCHLRTIKQKLDVVIFVSKFENIVIIMNI